MEELSSRYGWTPSQIRAEAAEDIDGYLSVIATKNRIEQAYNKKHGQH